MLISFSVRPLKEGELLNDEVNISGNGATDPISLKVKTMLSLTVRIILYTQPAAKKFERNSKANIGKETYYNTYKIFK